MNSGPKSIANCPGHFTLQVAQFTGRTAYDLNGPGSSIAQSVLDPRSSPLQTAHDDAEKLADKLSRVPEIKQLGQPVFVYHDRTSSRVFVGSFNSPKDPAVAPVHDELLKAAWKLKSTKDRWGKPVLDQWIVPASYLTDADEMKSKVR